MRDPVMYRIRNQHHFRTGDRWKVYPTYDWAHGQSDAIEGTTICSARSNRQPSPALRLVSRQPAGSDRPRQTEFVA